MGVITKSMLLACSANGTWWNICKVHLVKELDSSCSLQFMLNMRNEIASRDCELVDSYIVSTHTYKGVVALSATTSGTTIRLSESSYIHVHILSINSIVASSIIGLSGLLWHLWVVDISGLSYNSIRDITLASRHSFGTNTTIDSGSNKHHESLFMRTRLVLLASHAISIIIKHLLVRLCSDSTSVQKTNTA